VYHRLLPKGADNLHCFRVSDMGFKGFRKGLSSSGAVSARYPQIGSVLEFRL
jgi:hypothetical protein